MSSQLATRGMFFCQWNMRMEYHTLECNFEIMMTHVTCISVHHHFLLASGKRRRVAYNPNKWASSILTQRSKILALGVSYPSVQHQIDTEIGSKVGNIWK